jgi:diguanylate cyclase (GGDEF)-like protein
MKRLLLAISIFAGGTAALWATAPAPLTSVRAIKALSNAEAKTGVPVAFEATVTYFSAAGYVLFVQEDGVGIYVSPKMELVPGDRIFVRGKTAGSFDPIVISDSITLLGHVPLPKPKQATFDELIHSEDDSVLVTVRGFVRAADKADPYNGTNTALIQLLTDGGSILVVADGIPAELRRALLDAEVEITGVAGGQFDGKMQMHGIQINVYTPDEIKILHPAQTSPWSLPLTPMDKVITRNRVLDQSQRVRVHGTITYFQSGSSVVLQDGTKSIWVETVSRDPFQLGDVVDATGFPESHNGFLALAQGEIKDTHVQAPVTPYPTTRKELAASHNIIDLVSVEGQVMTAARGASQDEYALTVDGQPFSAVYRHPLINGALTPLQLPPMKQVPIGARVRVTGICVTEDSNPFNGQVSFEILMRTPEDIAVVAPPSPMNTRNLLILVGILIAFLFAGGARGWVLEHKTRRQTVALKANAEAEAELEKRRSNILEDINGARALPEIIEEITAMVSFGLKGVPCWCETDDGAVLGYRPPESEKLRVVYNPITARSGTPLGVIHAAFDPSAPQEDTELETLSVGGRLVTLAIESRQLHAELTRRSEFDLLTDIPNRFALEKFINAQVEEAGRTGRMLGLIYIDLDKFKPINDTYGHHAGDLYLKEVATRMNKQLLGGDMLARLGGDEFAALVTLWNGSSDLDSIVARLAHCFDTPFEIEGVFISGTASIGFALFPSDAGTIDGLLSAADAAMYRIKNERRKIAELLAQQSDLVHGERR